jgi:hypothetical protein
VTPSAFTQRVIVRHEAHRWRPHLRHDRGPVFTRRRQRGNSQGRCRRGGARRSPGAGDGPGRIGIWVRGGGRRPGLGWGGRGPTDRTSARVVDETRWPATRQLSKYLLGSRHGPRQGRGEPRHRRGTERPERRDGVLLFVRRAPGPEGKPHRTTWTRPQLKNYRSKGIKSQKWVPAKRLSVSWTVPPRDAFRRYPRPGYVRREGLYSYWTLPRATESRFRGLERSVSRSDATESPP